MNAPVALDTNVHVRLLLNDDTEQARRTPACMDVSPTCFVPITVIVVLDSVMRGAYKLPRASVIEPFDLLLAIRQLHVEQEDVAQRALNCHRQGLDFADVQHLLRSEGCAALRSFDRALPQGTAEMGLQPQVTSP